MQASNGELNAGAIVVRMRDSPRDPMSLIYQGLPWHQDLAGLLSHHQILAGPSSLRARISYMDHASYLFHTERQYRFSGGLGYPEALLMIADAAACIDLLLSHYVH